jgi:hypothetical protein
MGPVLLPTTEHRADDVRARGLGVTAAAWAVSLLRDIDPFFVKGDLSTTAR